MTMMCSILLNFLTLISQKSKREEQSTKPLLNTTEERGIKCHHQTILIPKRVGIGLLPTVKRSIPHLKLKRRPPKKRPSLRILNYDSATYPGSTKTGQGSTGSISGDVNNAKSFLSIVGSTRTLPRTIGFPSNRYRSAAA